MPFKPDYPNQGLIIFAAVVCLIVVGALFGQSGGTDPHTRNGLALIVIGIGLYFVPTFIARRKRDFKAIAALNILAGWTFVGWIVALVWALKYEPNGARTA